MLQIETEHAVHLLQWEENSEKLKITKEGLDMLRKIEHPFSSIGIIGGCRIGKSEFMNKMIGKEDLFATSEYSDACTKGVWLAVTRHPTNNHYVLVFDTEGLYDPDNDECRNEAVNKMFALMAMLSSTLVMMVNNSIDQRSLEQLKYLFEIRNNIQ